MERITSFKHIFATNLKINVAAVNGDSTVYDARIEDIRGDVFYITYPTEKGAPMGARKGMDVEISFISSGGRYSCMVKVIDRIMGRIPMLSLTFPQYLDKSELREFFRIEVLKKVKIFETSIVTRPVVGQVLEDNLIGEAFCMDISGGGARLLSDFSFASYRDVSLDFGATIDGLSIMTGTVARNFLRQDGKYDIGIRFNKLKDVDRDKIIKYVFKRQIEMRRLTKGI